MPDRTFTIEYSEIVTYVELVTAENEELAYKEFYKKMENNEYEENSCEMDDISIKSMI